jgi:hypothetical protein
VEKQVSSLFQDTGEILFFRFHQWRHFAQAVSYVLKMYYPHSVLTKVDLYHVFVVGLSQRNRQPTEPFANQNSMSSIADVSFELNRSDGIRRSVIGTHRGQLLRELTIAIAVPA